MYYSDALERYTVSLYEDERALATIEKYKRDISAFIAWLDARELTKATVVQYKSYLQINYKAASVNSMLAALNGFFAFIGRGELKVKKLRVQKQLFCDETKELTKAEYQRLVRAAKEDGNERLSLIIQTICSTGIRVSELKWISVESLAAGRTAVNNKGKTREIFLPVQMCNILRKYCINRGIRSGPVFITKSGKPVNRSNIWSDMKKLCETANVDAAKVFPHNLRHLFARTYYAIEKDLNRLADILGHSSIETTRIYTVTTANAECRKVNRLGLVV